MSQSSLRRRAASLMLTAILAAAANLAITGANPIAAAVPPFSIVALGTIPHGASADDCTPNGLNNRGQVVGEIGGQGGPPTGTAHAFLWQGGTMKDLGGLPGFTGSVAWSINERGEIAGNSLNAPFLGQQLPWTLFHGTFTQGPGALYPDAGAINSTGAVGGQWLSVDAAAQAVVWRVGSPELLPPAGFDSSVNALNDSGVAVGDVEVTVRSGYGFATVPRAVLWRQGLLTDLGRLGTPPGPPINGRGALALGVNASGWVVGWSVTAADADHGFVWIAGHMHDLGTLPNFSSSIAREINGSGDIVGDSSVYLPGLGTSVSRAVLWHQGRPIDLNSLKPSSFAGTLLSAHLINDRGQIVGLYSANPLGSITESCFLMTPVNG